MPDHAAGKSCPTFFRDELHEVAFDFFWVLVLCQSHTIRKSNHVCVDDNPGDTKRISQNRVRGFSPHAGEGNELCHRLGNFSTMARDDPLTKSQDGFRLVPIKTRRTNLRHELSGIRFRHRLRCWIFFEEGRNDQVHALIGTLCRKNHRDHKFIRIVIIQLTRRMRISFFEDCEDFRRPNVGWGEFQLNVFSAVVFRSCK